MGSRTLNLAVQTKVRIHIMAMTSKDTNRKSNGKEKKVSFSQGGQRRPLEGDDTQAAT